MKRATQNLLLHRCFPRWRSSSLRASSRSRLRPVRSPLRAKNITSATRRLPQLIFLVQSSSVLRFTIRQIFPVVRFQ